MNRILFAAARGAKVQKDDTWIGAWVETDRLDLWKLEHLPHLHRIHPDDSDLEYGPVSSALRKTAEDGKFADLPKVCGCEMMLWVVDSGPEWDSATKIHRRMFLLFLAEALADEGL